MPPNNPNNTSLYTYFYLHSNYFSTQYIYILIISLSSSTQATHSYLQKKIFFLQFPAYTDPNIFYLFLFLPASLFLSLPLFLIIHLLQISYSNIELMTGKELKQFLFSFQQISVLLCEEGICVEQMILCNFSFKGSLVKPLHGNTRPSESNGPQTENQWAK